MLQEERIAFKELPPAVPCLELELELNGAARRARVTGATLAGLVVLNFPTLQGQPCTETSRQRQSLLKTLELYFLKLPWLPLSFSSPATPANPVLQFRRGDLGCDAPLLCSTFL